MLLLVCLTILSAGVSSENSDDKCSVFWKGLSESEGSEDETVGHSLQSLLQVEYRMKLKSDQVVAKDGGSKPRESLMKPVILVQRDKRTTDTRNSPFEIDPMNKGIQKRLECKSPSERDSDACRLFSTAAAYAFLTYIIILALLVQGCDLWHYISFVCTRLAKMWRGVYKPCEAPTLASSAEALLMQSGLAPDKEMFLSETPQTWYAAFSKVCAASLEQRIIEHPLQGNLDESAMSYGALQQRADFLAAALEQRHNIGENSTVGLLLERGLDFMALLLACSRLGARAVPLPPDSPPERLRVIIQTSEVKVLCCEGALGAGVADLLDTGAIQCLFVNNITTGSLQQGRIATDPFAGGVVLSSSGSTGVPKLIARTQASFYHRLAWTRAAHRISRDEHCVQKSYMSTTHSLYEMLEPLMEGATLHILPDVSKTGLAEFWQKLQSIQPKRLLLVPSLMEATVNHATGASLMPVSLRIVILMGEEPKPGLSRRILAVAPKLQLYSIYGSTEASSSMVIDINEEICTDTSSEQFPLGKPIIDRIRTWVLDDHRQPVKDGEAGTLWFSGPQLFTEYVGARQLTAAQFHRLPPPPKDGQVLLFCTHDRVRVDANNRIEYLGRSDDVIKVRGNRVQLSEIEHHVLAVEGVQSCVTLQVKAEGTEPAIVSFVTPASVNRMTLVAGLSKHLPPYMLPQSVIAMHTMPLTKSSKVDRMALQQLYLNSDEVKEDVDDKGTAEFTDSLGIKKKGSQTAPDEIKLIRDLYMFGIVGIMISHWYMYEPLGQAAMLSTTRAMRASLLSIGANFWHARIVAMCSGYSDGMNPDPGRFNRKDAVWFSLIVVFPGVVHLINGVTCVAGVQKSCGKDFTWWPGPRVFLVSVFCARLFMVLMCRLRVPVILQLVWSFPFVSNYQDVMHMICEMVLHVSPGASVVLEATGLTLYYQNNQPYRNPFDYIVGFYSQPYVVALFKLRSRLSGGQAALVGAMLWLLFAMITFYHGWLATTNNENSLPELGSVRDWLPFGNDSQFFEIYLLVAWLTVAILAAALAFRPLQGVPDFLKHAFLGAFMLNGVTLKLGPESILIQLPEWTVLHAVGYGAYLFIFFGVFANLLQWPINLALKV